MRELLMKMMDEFIQAKKGPFTGNAVSALFNKDLPEALYDTGIIDKKLFIVKGSVGQGNWAMVPWVCIFDKEITTSAQNGVYVGFLFSADCQSLYLTLIQGMTDTMRSMGIRDTIESMRKVADDIVNTLNVYDFQFSPQIDLGDNLTNRAKMYQESTILYKKYLRNNMPEETVLLDDIKKVFSIYSEYKTVYVNPMKNQDMWLPLLTEYNPQITKENWLELLNNPEFINPERAAAIAAFHAEGDSATCLELAEKYHKDAPSISGICTTAAKKVAEITSCPIFESEGKKQYWYILFQSKNAEKKQLGDNIWKLRPELSAAIDETDIMDYLWKVGEPPKVLTPKEALERIKRYIAGSGFTYDSNLIENFYLSLKSKPFVILAGTSGTGKTRLVRLFAEAIGATSANGRYCQVAVRPDWSDSTDLFGHIDLNGNFVPGTILPFLKAATDDPKHPYILCLDEMNLARVEYYMSDFLSIIESRDFKDGEITSDMIMTLDKYGGKEEAKKKYGKIGFPQNLYIVGTVNMDETTFPFSRKVLDRANTIEFNYVDLGLQFSETLDAVEPYEADNSFLMSEYLVLGRDCQKYFDVIGPICAQLESINKILRKANAHVGYRVRDEIVFYLINNMNAELLTEDEAFDNSVMQKILPRIQGSSASIKTMLCELFESLSGQTLDANSADTSTAAAMQKIIDGGTVKYPKSAAKIKFMVQRFEEDGFTSYWL